MIEGEAMATDTTTELTTTEDAGRTDLMGLTTKGGFELIQRVAMCLSSSSLVPKDYQGKANLPNVVIALEMANRIGVSPLAVMQNLYIVHGKPSWSSTFIIASVNSCRRFTPLRFDMAGDPGKDNRTCIAWATETEFPVPPNAQTLALAKKAGLPVLEGSPVSIGLAKAEGWYGKNGSKWPNMSEQMLRYRAATFWGRLYAPDLLMGIRPVDELEDIPARDIIPARIAARNTPNGNGAGKPELTIESPATLVVPDPEPERTPEPAAEPAIPALPANNTTFTDDVPEADEAGPIPPAPTETPQVIADTIANECRRVGLSTKELSAYLRKEFNVPALTKLNADQQGKLLGWLRTQPTERLGE